MTLDQELQQMMQSLTAQEEAQMEQMSPLSAADKAAEARIRSKVMTMATAALAGVAATGQAAATKSALKSIKMTGSKLPLIAGSAAACAAVVTLAAVYHYTRIKNPEVKNPESSAVVTEVSTPVQTDVTQNTEVTQGTEITEERTETQPVTSVCGAVTSATAATTETTASPKTTTEKKTSGTTSNPVVTATGTGTTQPPDRTTPPSATQDNTTEWTTTETTTESVYHPLTETDPPEHEWWVWDGHGYWDNNDFQIRRRRQPTWETVAIPIPEALANGENEELPDEASPDGEIPEEE